MSKLRYLTAGESHGPALIGILEGMPAGLKLDQERIDHELRRRQHGHGRGGRMRIEQDQVSILSGIRFGQTTGGPITLLIENRDFWKEVMDPFTKPQGYRPVTIPRPGHADLAGAFKYGHCDLRDVMERASARETAIRVALGAIAKQFLEFFGIMIASHVVQIHDVQSGVSALELGLELTINERADRSLVRCLDPKAEQQMITRIDHAKERGDTVGGVFEVVAFGVPVGLGSYVHWDRRLDGRIAQALMSIPAIKGVEIGLGFGAARSLGSEVQDEIFYDGKFQRRSNRAGGIEGGVSNGESIVARAAMKPLSTLMKPLDSVDLITKKQKKAHRERSDVCAVPAAAVVGEAVMALVLADAILEKFGGDSIEEIKSKFEIKMS